MRGMLMFVFCLVALVCLALAPTPAQACGGYGAASFSYGYSAGFGYTQPLCYAQPVQQYYAPAPVYAAPVQQYVAPQQLHYSYGYTQPYVAPVASLVQKVYAQPFQHRTYVAPVRLSFGSHGYHHGGRSFRGVRGFRGGY